MSKQQEQGAASAASGKTELTNNVARNIESARENRGWSVGQLAERAGISKAYLYQIEDATTGISLDVAMKLSVALKIPLNGLVYGAYIECPSCRILTEALENERERTAKAIKILQDYPRPDRDGGW